MKIYNNKRPQNTKLHIKKCGYCMEEFGTYRCHVKTCSPECSKKYRTENIYGLPPIPVCKDGVCMISIKSHACYFDEEDFEIVNGKYWSFRKSQVGTLYAQTPLNGRPEVMHRMITNCPKGLVVDHIDGNGLNNRRSNLRLCKNKLNLYSSVSRHSVSKFKGVAKSNTNTNPWRAYIAPNRKQIALGFFKTEKEAAEAYNKAALKYFGEFALLNDVSNPGHFVSARQLFANDRM